TGDPLAPGPSGADADRVAGRCRVAGPRVRGARGAGPSREVVAVVGATAQGRVIARQVVAVRARLEVDAEVLAADDLVAHRSHGVRRRRADIEAVVAGARDRVPRYGDVLCRVENRDPIGVRVAG